MFVLLGILLYTGRFIVSGFCSVHFAFSLAGLKNINGNYSGNLVIPEYIIYAFHYTVLAAMFY